MKTDVQIAQQAAMEPIGQIAAELGLSEEQIEPYGRYKAKISLDVLKQNAAKPDGRLILVTAVNPTPAGEGKTTTNVGLSMALNKLGHKTICTLREPSLGPCFGIKGGAAGGGYSQVVPMDDINLHFTGDFHAITSAHNLLAAMLDNSIYQGNPLNIDPKQVVWKRVEDMNDRALRNIIIGLGKKSDGIIRQSGFDITVASEIMAILCLSDSMLDLKQRLAKIVVGYDYAGQPVTAGQLKAVGAMALLLKDALKPNLVQTLENTPAIIHGGPFANIAHGCNSVLATRTALKLAEYVVTEAGFGADLGAEKFFDIKCRSAQLKPAAAVVVVTVRALKYNGGVDKKNLSAENVQAVQAGSCNLRQHLENIALYHVPAIVAINMFPTDTAAELQVIKDLCRQMKVPAVESNVFAQGSQGGIDLARQVIQICDSTPAEFAPLYETDRPIKEKIETIARRIYRAGEIVYTADADKQISQLTDLGFAGLPICVAKTQYSFSDDPLRLGAPSGYELTVREAKVSAGAGFIVVLTGNIMTMPGLPKVPAAEGMDIDENGIIVGLS